MPERQALLEAAERLEQSTKDLLAKFEKVDDFSHETRHIADDVRLQARLLTVGLLILIVLTGVLWWTLDKANDANSRATRTAEYQVANCEATNAIRAQDREFWTNDVLAAIAPPGGSPGQKAFAAKIQSKVDKRYAPRDCSAVTEGRVR